MVWIPLGAWIGALVLAVIVLGFCAYEIVYKSTRLRGDLATLEAVTAGIGELQAQLDAVRQRVVAATRR